MSSFLFAKSEADGWAAIAKELETGLAASEPAAGHERLGWLYVTDVLAEDYGSLVTYLRQTTGIENWAGSVGMGICWLDGVGGGSEAFGRAAAVAMVGIYPTGGFVVLPRLGGSVAEIPEAHRDWMGRATPPFGVVHGDPMNA
ncbi:MAG: hypothetical protein VW405_04015, partial [Rhodospirillaceae bacterium]